MKIEDGKRAKEIFDQNYDGIKKGLKILNEHFREYLIHQQEEIHDRFM